MNIFRFAGIYMILLIIVLTGCGTSGDGNNFIATVLEANESSLLVEPASGSAELRSADRIIVNVRDATLVDAQGEAITIGEISVGRQVEIYYSGVIAESYPAQIQECFRIVLLD
ncbi:MAG TPA: hypothetical protein VLH18_08400 [Candidatus Limnocylindrales bacterium]|nr:hypothetical protein [Candidatus Limnocylindrales bacterium]